MDNLLVKNKGCVFDNHQVKLAKNGEILITEHSQWKLKY